MLKHFLVVLLLPLALEGQRNDTHALQRSILKELVEINTSDSAGHASDAARAMQARLLAAGFSREDAQLVGPSPKQMCLVARLRGGSNRNLKPLLMIAHLDVVDARREDWTTDPYTLVEKDGWFYGRGTLDDKQGDAILVSSLIRFKREGLVPDRDIVVLLTIDEETTSNSIQWVIANKRDLIDAEYALNADAGDGEIRDGKPVSLALQTAEKVYITYEMEVKSKGGHSSLPEPGNAIYRLSKALDRLAAYQFPVRLNETTRASLEKGAATQLPKIAADMRAVAHTGDPSAAKRLSAIAAFNATLRSTCVATRLTAGHADNALPQSAKATVNCRLLPDENVEKVTAQLNRVVADTGVRVRISDPAVPSPPSPLRPDVVGAVTMLASKYWPGVTVIPQMSAGATDGLYLRNAGIPVYGTSAIFDRIDDNRMHGKDERINLSGFYAAADYWYELLRTLTSPIARNLGK